MRASIRTVFIAAATTVVGAASVAAQQEPAETGIDVTRAVVATGVQDREPVGEATSFSADVGTVYFYTVLEGDFAEQTFAHVWLRDDEEVARVALNAAGPRWRTWSRKDIPSDWAGSWTVRLVDAQGEELASAEFTVGDGG